MTNATLPVARLLLLAAVFIAQAGNAQVAQMPGTHEYEWPADLRGEKILALKVPAAYDVFGGSHVKLSISKTDAGLTVFRQEMTLAVVWPEMEPRTASNDGEFSVPGGGKVIRAYIQSSAFLPVPAGRPGNKNIVDLPELDLASGEIDSNQLLKAASIRLGELKYFCSGATDPLLPPEAKECFHLKELAVKKKTAGLYSIGIDYKKFPKMRRDDIALRHDLFYAPALGRDLNTLIACMPWEIGDDQPKRADEIAYVPQCEHKFIFRPYNMLVTLSYRRVYLNDWEKIQDAVSRLLVSFQ